MNTHCAARWSLSLLFILSVSGIAPADTALFFQRNELEIPKVLSGQTATANAAWWGFNTSDVTDSLQAAIDSGAKTVFVPYMGSPWITRPVRLRGGQEIILEPGVVIQAKRGEFKGKSDCLLKAEDQNDITIRGYGATLRMWKKDYQGPDYAKGEWRMTLAFTGCKRIRVEGLRCESSGGDGVYIGSSERNHWCEDVVIRDVICLDNYRQGISVISAVNLLIENCTLAQTRGTAPGSGIDLEPDLPGERMVNCMVRNCVVEDNEGHAILIYLKPLTKESEPVSIRFENCLVRMNRGQTSAARGDNNVPGRAGIAVEAVRDDGPQGIIEFRNCVVENSGQEGVKLEDKSANGVRVRFTHCSWKNAWDADYPTYGGPRVPILLTLWNPEVTRHQGGIEFEQCAVYDTLDRPVLWEDNERSEAGLTDVTGDITVPNPYNARVQLGPYTQKIQLQLHAAQ
ncbi:MAG: hypothetical protein ACE15F_04835 [bacterium]